MRRSLRWTAPVASKTSTKLLEQIAALIESGQVSPHVGKTFPLDQAVAATTLSETGHGRGRIVLTVT